MQVLRTPSRPLEIGFLTCGEDSSPRVLSLTKLSNPMNKNYIKPPIK